MFGRRRGESRPSRSRAPGAAGPAGRRPVPVEVAGVIDGDSLTVRPTAGRDRDEITIRLFAVDAPEWSQPLGGEAREFLARAVQGRRDLLMEAVDTDRYGRLVAVLYRRGEGRRRSVNRLLVQQGLARWYSSYGGEDLGLPQAERDARRHRRGVWRAAQRRRPLGTPRRPTPPAPCRRPAPPRLPQPRLRNRGRSDNRHPAGHRLQRQPTIFNYQLEIQGWRPNAKLPPAQQRQALSQRERVG